MKKGVDFTGICVIFFCHDGNGRFVMGKRSNKTRDEHGRWDVGGGGLKFRETIEDALRRELKEEYGADVLDYEFLGYREAFREHEGNPTHWLAMDFKVLVDPAAVKIMEPDMFEEIGWFTESTMPEHVHSQLPLALARYEGRLFQTDKK